MSATKTSTRIYWATTGLLSLGMIGAGIQEVMRAPELVQGATALGYPDRRHGTFGDLPGHPRDFVFLLSPHQRCGMKVPSGSSIA